MPEWNPQANKIFLDALEIAEAEGRRTFIEQACGGDADLEAQVESLIDASQKAGRFLETPPLDFSFDPDRTVDFPRDHQVGRQIGPYRLLEQIGEGGMGTVFLAEQSVPVHRRVALKVIKAGMDSRQVTARFEMERQALAVMDHINIARVLDAGTTEQGRPYFVMELVRGLPITTYCDDNHLTPRQRLELFVPVCQAIQHAHQKGIIHRDIKPSNVLVTLCDSHPVPKVIDFGVAKAIEQKLTEQTLFTQHGTMVGTLEYMSPEQAETSHLGIDTRSDIYSLGVLLYELLTGSTPLSHKRVQEAAYAEIIRMIQKEEPPKPSARLSGSGEELASISARRHMEPARLAKLVRGELDWIVMKTLEKDRNRRYESASGLSLDVQRYLADEPVSACPPSAMYRIGKFARRNKAALATTAVVASALLLTTIALAFSNVLVRAERNEKIEALGQKVHALGEKQAALVEKEAALKEAKDNYAEAKRQEGFAKQQEQIARQQTSLGLRRLYASQMNLAMQAWRGGEFPRVLELLESQRPEGGKDDLRGFEWYYLWRLCSGGRIHLKGHADAVLSLSYSADGKTLASTGSDETIRLWDTATGRERLALRKLAPWDVIFSPDGQILASGGKTTPEVTLWNATTGELLHKIPATVDGLAFSPDGQTLLGGGLSTRLWDVASGAETATFAEAGLMVGMLNDQKTVVTLAEMYSERSEVRFWDKDSGERRLTIPIHEAVTAALSPDGTRVAASSGWTVKIWDTETGNLQSVKRVECSARGLAFSPDGKRLAAGCENRRVILWDVETGNLLGEDVHRDVVWAVVFSPDGQSVASSTLAGDIRLWNMMPPDEAAVIPLSGVSDLRFSQDGRTLFVGNSGPTSIVDVSTGQEVALLPFRGVSATSADGGRAARLLGDGQAAFWEMASAREIARLPVPVSIDGRSGVALSPEGKQAATFLSWTGDEKVTVWDLDTKQPRTLMSDIRQIGINCAVFSPDRKLLATGFHFQWVTVWDLTTGKVKLQFAQPPTMMEIISLAFSPDSKSLAVGTDIGTVTLWDVETGRKIAEFRGHTSDVNAMCFSPDGAVLATAGTDKTVKLWDARTGQERSTLTGHKGPVTKVLFSPDGNTLATASNNDGTVRLWRAATDPEALAPRSADSAFSEGAPTQIATSLVLPPGAFELTEAGLREAVRCWPEDAALHRRLGRLLQAERRPAEAERPLQEAARLDSDSEEGIRMLAEVLRQQKKFAEAETALREAIRLNPARPWTHAKLGRILFEQQKFAEAEQSFREAVRLQPDHTSGQRGLGHALRQQKKSAEALVPLREAIRLEPGDAGGRELLGWALLDLNQFAEAEAEFCEAVRLNPKSRWGRFGLAAAFRGQNNFPDSIDTLREAIQLAPANPEGYSTLAWTLLEGKQFAEAESAFRDVMRFIPDSATGQFGLGRALQKQQKHAEAIPHLRKSIQLNPKNVNVHDALGWALVSTEVFAEAEMEFREVIRLKPDFAQGHFGLGKSLLEQGKHSDAEAALRETLRLEPAHRTARDHLGRALVGQGKTEEAEALKKGEPDQKRPEPVEKKPPE